MANYLLRSKVKLDQSCRAGLLVEVVSWLRTRAGGGLFCWSHCSFLIVFAAWTVLSTWCLTAWWGKKAAYDENFLARPSSRDSLPVAASRRGSLLLWLDNEAAETLSRLRAGRGNWLEDIGLHSHIRNAETFSSGRAEVLRGLTCDRIITAPVLHKWAASASCSHLRMSEQSRLMRMLPLHPSTQPG